ncbi:MAG: chemotaxis protein CheW [Sulfurimonadaceae bacterium]|nr:chemotaxis protein CheW [Sulfurimonadaceae bacterium]
MQIEELLIIRHDDIRYGIRTDDIEHILRVPEVTPLALSPDEVNGLCAVGGNIITVMDTNKLLGLKPVVTDHADSRLLTLSDTHSHIGLLVSMVVDTEELSTEKIDYIDEPEDAIVAIYNDGETIIQILDLNRLFESLQIETYRSKEVSESISRGEEEGSSGGKYDRFLLFKMDKERYAVKIDNVREIIAVTPEMTEIAGSRPEICGMISLREELLVVADLRTYYGFEAKQSDKNRILVMHSNGRTIGLIIDEIIDIREYRNDQIDAIPENFRNSKTSGVIHDSEQLVSLIGKNVLDGIFKTHEKLLINSTQDEELEESDTVMEVVVFRLGEEEYAIDIEGVSEIIDKTEVTPVNNAPEYIDGVINIRGQVVTIGSLHKRLGIETPTSEDQKIIVCRAGKNRIGFFVNSVSDVMDVSRDELRDESSRGELFTKVLHFDQGNRLVLLFDLSVLIEEKSAA